MGMFRRDKNFEKLCSDVIGLFHTYIKDIYYSFTNKEIRQKVWTLKNIVLIASGLVCVFIANLLFSKLLIIIPEKHQIWIIPCAAIAWFGIDRWERRLNQKKGSPH